MPQTLNKLHLLAQGENSSSGLSPSQLARVSWPIQDGKSLERKKKKAGIWSESISECSSPEEQGTWPAWHSEPRLDIKPCQETNPVIREAPRGQEELQQRKTLKKSSNKVTKKFASLLG